MPSRDVGTSDSPSIRIASSSGSITVVAEPRTDVVADGSAAVEVAPDGSVEVLPLRRSTAVTVRCPEGSSLVVGTGSGSLHLQGHLGPVRATTVSGRLQADDVTSADLRAMSGSIRVGSCAGTCRAKTKSGSVRVGSARAVEVAIGSGSIEIGHVEDSARVRAVSGSVAVGAGGRGPIEVETMSGSITITLPPDCRPNVHARSLSSRPRVELPAGRDCEVVARTLSGAIVIRST